MDYDWLWRVLSADIPSGALADVLDPSRVSQRGRAQLASNRRFDRAHQAAQKYNADKEMALRELANEQARVAYNAEHGIVPMTLAPVPNQVKSAPPAPQRPYPGQGAPVRPPIVQRPYPGQGAPVRPPIPQQAVTPPQRRPAPPPARPAPQISPQDYYAMLKAGMFRMG